MAPTGSSPTLEDVVLRGRLLLGREPESAEVVQMHARAHRFVSEIGEMFMRTWAAAIGTGRSHRPRPASLARRRPLAESNDGTWRWSSRSRQRRRRDGFSP
jgi:hypothetical protein